MRTVRSRTIASMAIAAIYQNHTSNLTFDDVDGWSWDGNYTYWPTKEYLLIADDGTADVAIAASPQEAAQALAPRLSRPAMVRVYRYELNDDPATEPDIRRRLMGTYRVEPAPDAEPVRYIAPATIALHELSPWYAEARLMDEAHGYERCISTWYPADEWHITVECVERGDERFVIAADPDRAAHELADEVDAMAIDRERWVSRVYDVTIRRYGIMDDGTADMSWWGSMQLDYPAEEPPCIRGDHIWGHGSAYGDMGREYTHEVCRVCGIVHRTVRGSGRSGYIVLHEYSYDPDGELTIPA